MVTPAGLVYEQPGQNVVARTTDGEIEDPTYAPIIVPLAIDEVRVKRIDSDTHVVIDRCQWRNRGIAGQCSFNCKADSAERDRDIDVSRAERQTACRKANRRRKTSGRYRPITTCDCCFASCNQSNQCVKTF